MLKHVSIRRIGTRCPPRRSAPARRHLGPRRLHPQRVWTCRARRGISMVRETGAQCRTTGQCPRWDPGACHHCLPPLTRAGGSKGGARRMTSEVDGTLRCVRSSASVGPLGPGVTLARARSKRDLGALSKRNSRYEGSDHHPAAEKRTPSTQAKAACRRTGRGRSVLRNTRMEMAAMTVTMLKLGMILRPVQGASGLHDALPRKGNDTLRLAFFLC